MRAALLAVWVIAAGATGATLGGCPSAAFEEHGPATFEPGDVADARGRPRPMLLVEPATAFEDEARRVDVVATTSESGVVVVDLIALRTDIPADDPVAREPVRLRYQLGAGLDLPLSAGGRYWLRTSSRRGGQGLLVWNTSPTPRLLAALSIDQGLADDAVPGLTVVVGQAVAPVYTEVRTLPSGCITALDHLVLRARTTLGTLDIAPGGRGSVEAQGERFDIVSLDASRPNSGLAASDPTQCPGGAHVSWLARVVIGEPSDDGDVVQ